MDLVEFLSLVQESEGLNLTFVSCINVATISPTVLPVGAVAIFFQLNCLSLSLFLLQRLVAMKSGSVALKRSPEAIDVEEAVEYEIWESFVIIMGEH